MPDFGKTNVVIEGIVVPGWMIVNKELQIPAHDESVKELLVDDREFRHGIVFPWVMHIEPKVDFLVGLDRPRSDRQIEVILNGIGNSGNQFHSTARTRAGTIGANVVVHRTGVDQILLRVRNRWNLCPRPSSRRRGRTPKLQPAYSYCILQARRERSGFAVRVALLRSRSMKRSLLMAISLCGLCPEGRPHDIGSTPTTWNREISRVFYQRCVSCHHEGGTAFSLMTYQDAQPRAVAIKEAVLSRRMPPWGAVKGFGDFKNDQGLTQEELELITDWIEGDTVKGNNPNVLPKPPKFTKPPGFKTPKNGIVVKGDFTLTHAITLDGLLPEKVPQGSSAQIVAVLPDGDVEPLVWLYEYKDTFRHPFLFRTPLDLPSGTQIRGLSADASIVLIPGKKRASHSGGKAK